MRWNNAPELTAAAGVVASFSPYYMKKAQDLSLDVMRRIRVSDARLAERANKDLLERRTTS